MIERIYPDIAPTDLTDERYVLVEDGAGRGYLVSDRDREEGRGLFGHRLRRVEIDVALIEAAEEPGYTGGRIDGFAYVDEDPRRGGFGLFVYGQAEEIPLSADEAKTILFAREDAGRPDD